LGSFSKRLATVAAVAAVSVVAASAAQAATVETVATGLDNPRSVAFHDGAVYVANAGRGGRQCQGEGEEAMCVGTTGRIVRVAADGSKSTVARGMFSLAGEGGPFATGLHGVSVAPDGSVFGVTGSATPRQIADVPRPVRSKVGRLFSASGGAFSAVARVDKLEHRRNLDNVKGDKNSNPYAVLALAANHQIVVDAGANAVLEVRDGKVSLLSLIPNRRGGRRQSVPSSIALGPDGAYYVGELAESSGKGKARVWRVPAEGGTATVYRSGFTAITGVAFGPDGSLFVTEFALNFEKLNGRLIQVSPDGATRTVLAGGKKLTAPTGAAVDPATGAVYVSNFSVLPRSTPRRSPFRGAGGTLVKITP
jgi:DNA-binding beta-propeller fold protein YncE